MKNYSSSLTTYFVAALLASACASARDAASPGETRERWLTGPVIASVERASGECFYCYFSLPPEAVLYADGLHILAHEFQFYERTLPDDEVCSLLTDIDRSGYFEYSGEQYEQFYTSNAMKPNSENYRIDIDAWKSNSLELPGFGLLFDLHQEAVEWPAALRIPYQALAKVDPSSMQVYLPERVAVHIEEDPDLGFELAEWRTSSPSLTDLIARYADVGTPESESSEGELILTGTEARAMLVQFNDRAWGAENVFVLDDQRYVVAIRALLPYENGGGRDGERPSIPDPGAEHPPVARSCAVE